MSDMIDDRTICSFIYMRLINTHVHLKQEIALASRLVHCCLAASSASEISFLDPALFLVGQDVAYYNRDFWERSHQSVEPDAASRVCRQYNLVQGHSMVREHLHSHECSAPTGHLCVQQKHAFVLVDILRKPQVMEFWFAR